MDDSLPRRIGARTGAALVIASIVGAGIFTSAGFVARHAGSPAWLLGLWAMGGAIAGAGALCYAELAAAMPEAGGEYVYLREAYGPLLGYLSGWTSFFVGFSGAIAAALLGLTAYLGNSVPALNSFVAARLVALAVLWTITMAHGAGLGVGEVVQNVLTAGTVAAITALITAGFIVGHGAAANFSLSAPADGSVAVGLIFVLYAYSGWNGAAYLAGEMREPARTVPRSMIAGTAAVTVLYLGLNALYLYAMPMAKMAGVVDIGARTASVLFGGSAARLIAGLIVLAILSSVSAMVLLGPRVYYAMAHDLVIPGAIAVTTARVRAPVRALILQSAWVSVLILFFGTFERLVIYTGIALTIFTALAAGAVIVLRVRQPGMPRPFRVPAYPWLPLAYIGISLWIVAYTFSARPEESALGLLTVLAGVPIYFAWKYLAVRSRRHSAVPSWAQCSRRTSGASPPSPRPSRPASS